MLMPTALSLVLVMGIFLNSACLSALHAAGPAAVAPASAFTDAPDLPVKIAATDPNLHYVGRFAVTPDGGSCRWPNSRVDLKFKGTAINVRMSETAKDFWQVFLDGKPTLVLPLEVGPHTYSLASDLSAGEHTLSLVKRTEAMVGGTTITGFQLSRDGTLLPVIPLTRKLEVIGDSISCGYGNEAAQKDHFDAKSENATLTYGALAADVVGAEYFCIAWSGKKMWPDNSIPEIYDRTLPKDPLSQWDFSMWIPDVVVVNLGANDFYFSKVNPEEGGWVAAYKAFISRLRSHEPKAVIYCALNPLTGDQPPRLERTALTSYLHQVVDDLNGAGDLKIHFLEFKIQKQEDGIGADSHPSLRTHQIMSAALLASLAQDPGWQPVSAPPAQPVSTRGP